MATGSGLDAQFGFGEETNYGTAVTPDLFLEANSEDLHREPTFVEGQGLRAGKKFKRSSRTTESRSTVNGSVTMEHATKGMGLIWAHCLGSAGTVATVSGGTAAHEQYHVPGGFKGKSLTIQVGEPEPGTGTVQPFTYAGCKITAWEFTLPDGDTPTLQVTFDGRSLATSTALATASYISGSGIFSFKDATLKLGGSASTTSGKTSVTGGTAVSTVVTEVTLSGETPMAVERFGVGNTGLKNEPLENDFPTITGSLAAEFSKTELFDKFVNGDVVPAELELLGGTIEGTTREKLSFILPAVRIKAAAPNVGGPDIVQMSCDIEGYDDGTTNPPIQVHLVSTDTSI